MDEELIDKVKSRVADPTKAPALHDLLQAEAARVIEGMQGQRFSADAPFTPEDSVRVTRCGVRRSCTRPSCAGAAKHCARTRSAVSSRRPASV